MNVNDNPYASENTGHHGRMSNPDGRPCATYHPETQRAARRLRWITGGCTLTVAYQAVVRPVAYSRTGGAL